MVTRKSTFTEQEIRELSKKVLHLCDVLAQFELDFDIVELFFMDIYVERRNDQKVQNTLEHLFYRFTEHEESFVTDVQSTIDDIRRILGHGEAINRSPKKSDSKVRAVA